MAKSYHMSMNVSYMANISKKKFISDWKGVAKDDHGRPFTYEQVKLFFSTLLQQGHVYYPLGNCDNFDPQTGCKGHEVQGNGQGQALSLHGNGKGGE